MTGLSSGLWWTVVNESQSVHAATLSLLIVIRGSGLWSVCSIWWRVCDSKESLSGDHETEEISSLEVVI